MRGMTSEAGAVFAFTQEGDAMVFTSLADAASYMEAIDVEDGEYAALFLIDGRIVAATTGAENVVLTVTADRDEHGLKRRVREYRLRAGEPPVDDLVAVANDWLQRDWERRWPRWPHWLTRRRRGEGPPSV